MIITLKQKLIDIVSSLLQDIDCELIGIECICNRKMIIRIYIDKIIKGITVDDCADISRKISLILDREKLINVSYILEVSSPGFDRPLFSISHFVEFIGSDIKIILYHMINGRRRWRGTIKSVHDELITLSVGGKDENFIFNNIQKANLISSFNKL